MNPDDPMTDPTLPADVAAAEPIVGDGWIAVWAGDALDSNGEYQFGPVQIVHVARWVADRLARGNAHEAAEAGLVAAVETAANRMEVGANPTWWPVAAELRTALAAIPARSPELEAARG